MWNDHKKALVQKKIHVRKSLAKKLDTSSAINFERTCVCQSAMIISQSKIY